MVHQLHDDEIGTKEKSTYQIPIHDIHIKELGGSTELERLRINTQAASNAKMEVKRHALS